MRNIIQSRSISYLLCTLLAFFISTAQAAEGSRVVRQSESAAARANHNRNQTQNTVTEQPRTFGEPLLIIEELTADLYNDNTVLLIQGQLTNKSHRPMRGYVLVKILDKDDNVIAAIETEINESRKFYHGQSRPFEEAVDVSSIKGMANVAIEFVQL